MNKKLWPVRPSDHARCNLSIPARISDTSVHTTAKKEIVWLTANLLVPLTLRYWPTQLNNDTDYSGQSGFFPRLIARIEKLLSRTSPQLLISYLVNVSFFSLECCFLECYKRQANCKDYYIWIKIILRSLIFSPYPNSWGGQGVGARANRGREGYGRREEKGREARFPQWREPGEKEKNFAIFCNILR